MNATDFDDGNSIMLLLYWQLENFKYSVYRYDGIGKIENILITGMHFVFLSYTRTQL